MPEITDGTGGGYLAGVTEDNHLETISRTLDFSSYEALEGRSYNYNTGTIALTTTASENGVLYVKNTGDYPMVFSSFFYLLGTPASSGDWLVRVYRNPTSGTLISAGTAAVPVNRDFGSTNRATGTFLTGADAKTVTDGVVAIESIFSSSGRKVVGVGAIVLRQGNSIAFTVKPPAAANIQLAVGFYEKNLEH